MKLNASCNLLIYAATDSHIITMLRPRSGAAQWVLKEHYELKPWVPTTEFVDSYGNLCQRLVVPKGEMRIAVESEVEVEDHIARAPQARHTLIAELPYDAIQYLLPSRYCPSDKMMELARDIVGNASAGYAQVETIRAWIHNKLEYKYGVSDATTDALETLAHGAGVCRDFSHVGIALCRSLQIPARMVAGYLHRLDPMDLHAWFEAFVGGRWYTFDPTQTTLRGGRIVVGYGRDATDVAFISDYCSPPLEVREIKVEVTSVNDQTHKKEVPITRPQM